MEVRSIQNKLGACGGTVKTAKGRFNSAYFSGRRIIYGAVAVGFVSAAFLSYFSGIIPAVAISLGIEAIRVGIASYGLHRKPLIDQLVRISLDIDNVIIARDLFADRSRRGYQKLVRQYLLGLREADGTKFNEMLVLLRADRRWQRLAQSFNQ